MESNCIRMPWTGESHGMSPIQESHNMPDCSFPISSRLTQWKVRGSAIVLRCEMVGVPNGRLAQTSKISVSCSEFNTRSQSLSGILIQWGCRRRVHDSCFEDVHWSIFWLRSFSGRLCRKVDLLCYQMWLVSVTTLFLCQFSISTYNQIFIAEFHGSRAVWMRLKCHDPRGPGHSDMAIGKYISPNHMGKGEVVRSKTIWPFQAHVFKRGFERNCGWSNHAGRHTMQRQGHPTWNIMSDTLTTLSISHPEVLGDNPGE